MTAQPEKTEIEKKISELSHNIVKFETEVHQAFQNFLIPLGLRCQLEFKRGAGNGSHKAVIWINHNQKIFVLNFAQHVEGFAVIYLGNAHSWARVTEANLFKHLWLAGPVRQMGRVVKSSSMAPRKIPVSEIN